MPINQFNNKIGRSINVRDNTLIEGTFPEIKPPISSNAHTDWGDCLVISGTESLIPVSVTTTASSAAIQAGDIITAFEINPSILAQTRLAKVSENYERWYPRKIALEFVPQGSALDVGAVISIPVLDPGDSFTGETGIEAIRRAMAYEKSFAFNIYDHPYLPFPEVEADEPYYVEVGNNARLEIPYVWYLMAQDVFEPRGSETMRTLGWFKLHYVIELYHPKIPQVDAPETYLMTESATAKATVFAGSFVEGDLMVGGDTIFFPGHTQAIYRVNITSSFIWNGPVTIQVNDNKRTFDLLRGTVIYAKIDHEFTPTFLFYSNLQDCFANNNPLNWALDYTAVTSFTGNATVTALTTY
jgi:hypothetical protein